MATSRSSKPKLNGTWEHIKNHAIAYGTTAVLAALGTTIWLGGQTVLDGRYLVADAHADEHVEIQKSVDEFKEDWRDYTVQSEIRSIRKDLNAARRERRRFEAYLSADPQGAMAAARSITVAELTDEISELEEELELARERAANDD